MQYTNVLNKAHQRDRKQEENRITGERAGERHDRKIIEIRIKTDNTAK